MEVWLTATAVAALVYYVWPASTETVVHDWTCAAVWHATYPSHDSGAQPIHQQCTLPLTPDLHTVDQQDEDVCVFLQGLRRYDRWATHSSRYLLIMRHNQPVLRFDNVNAKSSYGVLGHVDVFTDFLKQKQNNPAWVPQLQQ
jgi:hypothetical protein